VEVLGFLLILAAVGAVAFLSWRRRQQRREALRAFALRNSLEFSTADPFGLTGSPFHLFSLGDGRGCENVLWGTWQGVPMRAADYWYYTESTDSKGHRSRSYHRFSVALADLAVTVPPVRLEKEGALSKLADHLGFHDLAFESERFNRMYRVKAADGEFAFKLIDARMIRWLESLDGGFGFEVSGSEMLVWSDRRKPNAMIPLLGCVKLFQDHIPRLVWMEFGSRPGQGPAEERSSS
jgi:hypothetical protein